MAEVEGHVSRIGAFLIGAAALTLGTVLLLGWGLAGAKTLDRVAYFDNAVTGLDAGAPVIFQGVAVGSVEKIVVVVDDETRAVSVPVYFTIEPDAVNLQEEVGEPSADEVLQHFVDRGLRAQLKMQSFVTGKLYLDLAFHPDTEPNYKGYDSDVREMPTIPSDMQRLQAEAKEFIDRLRHLPIDEIVEHVRSMTASLDRLLQAPAIPDAVDRLAHAVKRIDAIVSNPAFDDTPALLNTGLQSVGTVAANANKVVEPGSPTLQRIHSVLEELEKTARSVRTLADTLQRNPEELLFGRHDRPQPNPRRERRP